MPMPGVITDGKLTCKVCQCTHFEVSHVYEWTAQGKVRRRQCRHCGWVVKTIEMPIDKNEP